MLVKDLVIWINKLIQSDNIKAFYNCALWKKLRLEILREQNHECQMCKANGIYEGAVTVHHIKHVKDNPELALTKENLMALCKECHYQIHHTIIWKKQLNEEKW